MNIPTSMKKFNLLAILMGSVIATSSIFGSENLFVTFYFNPTKDSITVFDIFKDAVNVLPFSFYALVICCNLCASLIAGTIPLIIGDEALKHSLTIGVIVAAFATLNCCLIPFPVWYKIVSIVMVIPATYVGSFVLKRVTTP